MAFEVDTVFYTETMMKILQSQGHFQYAIKIGETLLSEDPGNLAVRDLLRRLKEGDDEEVTDPGTPLEQLKVQEAQSSLDHGSSTLTERRLKKLEKLYALLKKVKERSAP